MSLLNRLVARRLSHWQRVGSAHCLLLVMGRTLSLLLDFSFINVPSSQTGIEYVLLAPIIMLIAVETVPDVRVLVDVVDVHLGLIGAIVLARLHLNEVTRIVVFLNDAMRKHDKS